MIKALLLALAMTGAATMALAQSSGAGSSSYGGAPGPSSSPPSLSAAPPAGNSAAPSPSTDIQNSQQPGIGINNGATSNPNLQPGAAPAPKK